MSDAIIEAWQRRAPGYADLVGRYAIFRDLASRLVAGLPPDFAGRALDLGAGTGLASEVLLAERPLARVQLVEPAPAMLERARARLGARAEAFWASDAESLSGVAGPFAAALANAAAHLFDEKRVWPALARRLEPDAPFVFNLWGHSFDETAGEPSVDGRRALSQALVELGHEPLADTSEARQVRTRAGLERLAEGSGFSLERLEIDEDHPSGAFTVDLAATDAAWLAPLGTQTRERVLARARELASAPVRVQSVRVTLRRVRTSDSGR